MCCLKLLLMSTPDNRIGTELIRLGSLEDPIALREATRIIRDGGVVAVQVYGVFGIFCDGANDEALDLTLRIKDQSPSQERPFSNMRFSSTLADQIDSSKVNAGAAHLCKDLSLTGRVLGSLVHLRWPIRNEAADEIPRRLRSQLDDTWIIHNLDPSGHPVSALIAGLNDVGVTDVAVTTLNAHGQDEISNRADAKAFCSEHGIQLLLTDPSHENEEVKGSFPIFDTMSGKILRHGILPESLVATLLAIPTSDISSDSAPQAKYKQALGLRLFAYFTSSLEITSIIFSGLSREIIKGGNRARKRAN